MESPGRGDESQHTASQSGQCTDEDTASQGGVAPGDGDQPPEMRQHRFAGRLPTGFSGILESPVFLPMMQVRGTAAGRVARGTAEKRAKPRPAHGPPTTLPTRSRPADGGALALHLAAGLSPDASLPRGREGGGQCQRRRRRPCCGQPGGAVPLPVPTQLHSALAQPPGAQPGPLACARARAFRGWRQWQCLRCVPSRLPPRPRRPLRAPRRHHHLRRTGRGARAPPTTTDTTGASELRSPPCLAVSAAGCPLPWLQSTAQHISSPAAAAGHTRLPLSVLLLRYTAGTARSRSRAAPTRAATTSAATRGAASRRSSSATRAAAPSRMPPAG